MKCPRCNGEGSVPYHIADDLFDETNCPLCGGSGEVEMTNEEWFCSLDTEEKAEFLNLIIRVGPYENEPKDFWEHVYGRGGEYGAKSIVTWLKQPHNSPK